MVMKRYLIALFALVGFLQLPAQALKRVSGECIYHFPENISPEEGKRMALERLKTQLIADEFGTVVAQTNTTFVENTNGISSVDFQSHGASEVKGEWIETIGIPEYSVSFEQNMLVVKVRVEGKIREIKSAKADFDAKILCNGTEDSFERSDFKNDDRIYVSFTSPTDGYVAIYLIDSKREANCLLPYPEDADGKVFVKHGKRYVFFSRDEKHKSGEDTTHKREYHMTCGDGMESNFVYIIFSPKAFTKANDKEIDENLPQMLSYTDFQDWLSRCRRRDKDMVIEVRQITVKNGKSNRF